MGVVAHQMMEAITAIPPPIIIIKTPKNSSVELYPPWMRLALDVSDPLPRLRMGVG
eukprot:CAMPEP_0198120262 /NCGR_PEP_ID=MMETSP1442-20131203/28455_1 /TAXON_ID= /ORGANISM="Craspedostauros australis, Strain CCMP3328" /LENGTH=55 /DNA_ID=CAMNT_0043778881 /DNA_START=169 /DNA_END=332 /DNA_ORIENTATION=-